jgi:hypothetical protein
VEIGPDCGSIFYVIVFKGGKPCICFIENNNFKEELQRYEKSLTM